MSTATTETKVDPAAVFAERTARLAELRAAIQRLDGEEREAAEAVALALAEGGDARKLRETRQRLREELDDRLAALPHLEALVRGADEAGRTTEREAARGAYAAARHREREATAELERIVEGELLPALRVVRSAGRESYALGRDCGAESSVDYRRRLSTLERFILTRLSSVYESFRVTPAKLRVENLNGVEDGRE